MKTIDQILTYARATQTGQVIPLDKEEITILAQFLYEQQGFARQGYPPSAIEWSYLNGKGTLYGFQVIAI